MTRPLLAPCAGDVFAGVRFRAAMAREFVRTVATELANTVLPLSDVWGRRGRELEEQLRNACGAEEMLSSLESVLKPPSEISPVQNAIGFLTRNAGSVSLKEISRHAGVSERHLRRRCLEETGISPKHLARIARFRRACSFIHSHAHPQWSILALECGYYDQAHFIREFQEFSGSTPADYLAQLVA